MPHDLTDTSSFSRATVDPVRDRVAVLDENGVILTGNTGWRRLADEAGARGDVVASSYLDAFDYPSADLTTRAAATGLRGVLRGESDYFSTTSAYPSPSGNRWFRLVATRYRGAGPGSVAVVHDDVTDQVAAEMEVVARDGTAFPSHVRQSSMADRQGRVGGSVAVSVDGPQQVADKSYLDAVTDSMGEGLFVVDAEGLVTMVNPAAEAMLGWSLADIEGLSLHDLTHYRREDGTAFPADECLILEARAQGRTVRVSHDMFVTREGRDLPVRYTSAPLRSVDGREGCVVVFRDASHMRAEEARLRSRVETLSSVHRVEEALREHRFMLYAQPIVDIRTGRTTQHELLLRVREADGSVAGPMRYLTAAEEHGLIGTIDRWVVGEALALAAQPCSVELNVSATSVSDPSLLVDVERMLRESGADPARLVFEITETTLISNEEAGRRFVQRLHDLGCKVALDDFGTGYGGFTYLKHLPLDYLKIDIEFVRDLLVNRASRHVVEAVVNLAAGFELQTVAEGVEDAETLELLGSLGVGLVQGFHLGRPAPLTDTLFSRTKGARAS